MSARNPFEQHAWGPLPPPLPPPPPPPPARFSGLCAASLVAAVLAGFAIGAEGEFGTSLAVSVFAVLLAVTALAATWGQRLSNRWMARVALTGGAAPIVLVVLLFALLSGALG